METAAVQCGMQPRQEVMGTAAVQCGHAIPMGGDGDCCCRHAVQAGGEGNCCSAVWTCIHTRQLTIVCSPAPGGSGLQNPLQTEGEQWSDLPRNNTSHMNPHSHTAKPTGKFLKKISKPVPIFLLNF